MVSSILFVVLFIAGSAFFALNVRKIRRNILLGKDIDRKDDFSERLKTMLLVAFGQKKMFSRPIPALLHLFIYAAFVIMANTGQFAQGIAHFAHLGGALFAGLLF